MQNFKMTSLTCLLGTTWINFKTLRKLKNKKSLIAVVVEAIRAAIKIIQGSTRRTVLGAITVRTTIRKTSEVGLTR